MNPSQTPAPGYNPSVLMDTGNLSLPGQANNNGPLTMTFHAAAEQNQAALNQLPVPPGTGTNNDVSRPITTQQPPQPSSAQVIPTEQSDDIYMYTGKRSLEKDFLDLSVADRLRCMRNFWAARQDTFYFRLRFIRELQSNATVAMTRLFDGSTLDRKMDVRVEQFNASGNVVFVSGYLWPGVQKHVKASGCTEDIATRNAAIEALKVIMTENEFNLVCFFCSNKIYEGVLPQQVQELLRFEKNSPTAQPDPVILAAPTNNAANDYFLHMTRDAFIKLPQAAKEDFVLRYWLPIFSCAREDQFPRVYQLFHFYDIEDNAADAFSKLFTREEIKNGSFSMKTEAVSTNEDECEKKYLCTLAWNAGDRQGTKIFEAYTPYGAENLAGILALREILGPLYDTIVHLSKPHFYSGINFSRVEFLLLEALQSNIPEEVATNPKKRLRMEAAKEENPCVALEKLLAAKGQPPPTYKISEAYAVRCTVREHTFESVYRSEKDAKNMASFQALEFLWGGKLHI